LWSPGLPSVDAASATTLFGASDLNKNLDKISQHNLLDRPLVSYFSEIYKTRVSAATYFNQPPIPSFVVVLGRAFFDF